MIAIKGTVKNGQVVLDEPEGLPEGTRVEVMPADVGRLTVGMREEDWPTTPNGKRDDEGPMTEEEIKAVLAAMEQIEGGWLSPEDDAAWRAALREQKEYEKARFFDDAEKLRRMWE